MSINQQCHSLGIRCNRIAATDGKLLFENEKKKFYNHKKNKEKYHKVLTNGELGCYLSHLACWKKIIADNLDFALILEDDALLENTLPQFIELVGKLAPEWDYIKLSHGRKIKAIGESLIDQNLTLGTCLKLPSTTTGQFVSKAGAQKLIDSALPISRPVDIDIQHWFEKNLRCYVVRPFPIKSGNFTSDINQIYNRKKIPSARLQKLLLKCQFELNLYLNKHKQGQLPQVINLL